MIEVLPESQGNVIGIKITGKLTAQEYEEVMIPTLEAAIQAHGKLNFLGLVDEDFHGMEAAALWDDTKFGLKHRKDFGKMALVGARRWMEWMMKFFAPMMAGEIKSFPREQLKEAWDWVKS
jgi:hypothetical protein